MQFFATLACVFIFIAQALAHGQTVPDLGLSLDQPQGDPEKTLYRWSSKLTFHGVDDPWKDIFKSDEKKLAQVVKDAYWQMNQIWLRDNIGTTHRVPAMSGLLVGSEMYLASSLKGGAFLYYLKDESNPVYQVLLKCQIDLQALFRDATGPIEHKNEAKCGEIMALYMYFQDHPDGRDALQGARIVTIRHPGNMGGRMKSKTTLDYDKYRIFNACAKELFRDRTQIKFGCYLVTLNLGLIALEEKADYAATIGSGFTPDMEFDESFNLPVDKNIMTTSRINLVCNIHERESGQS